MVAGDDWKRIRSIVSPAFSSGKMKKMYPMIKGLFGGIPRCTRRCVAEQGKGANIKDLYGNYTMDVIATCAFCHKN